MSSSRRRGSASRIILEFTIHSARFTTHHVYAIHCIPCGQASAVQWSVLSHWVGHQSTREWQAKNTNLLFVHPRWCASLSSPASSHSWDESGKRGTSIGSCIFKIPHSNQLEYRTLCHLTDNNTRVKASILMKRTKYETLEESFLYASLPINSQRSFSSICNTGDSCMFRGFLKHYFICSPRRSAFSGSYCYIYKCRWKRMKH